MTYNISSPVQKFGHSKEVRENWARKYGVCHLCGPYVITEEGNVMCFFFTFISSFSGNSNRV